MMKLIGFKRALLLGIFLAINLVLGSVYLLGIEPMRSEAQMTYDSVNGEIGGLQGRIQNIKQEMALYQESLPKYEALHKNGFFLEQDRFRMGRDLGDVRGASGLRGFSYNIADIKDMPNSEAASQNMRLINSRIDINNVDTITDEEFYRFLDLMQTQFPTHVRVQSFRMQRAGILDEQVLKSLAGGQTIRIVDAAAVIDWMTIVPLAPAVPAAPVAPQIAPAVAAPPLGEP